MSSLARFLYPVVALAPIAPTHTHPISLTRPPTLRRTALKLHVRKRPAAVLCRHLVAARINNPLPILFRERDELGRQIDNNQSALAIAERINPLKWTSHLFNLAAGTPCGIVVAVAGCT